MCDVAQSPMDSGIAGREIAGRRRDFRNPYLATGFANHTRAVRKRVGWPSPQIDRQPMVCGIGPVLEQDRWPFVVDGQQIDLAIIIEIDRGGPTSHHRSLNVFTQLGNDVDKPAPAIIPEQAHRLAEGDA